MASPKFPEAPPSIPPTSLEECDALVRRLAEHRGAWVQTSIPERVQYLQKVIEGMNAVAPAMVADGCRKKGIPVDSSLAGEEWLAAVTTTIRNARLLIEALEAGGQPRPPAVKARPDGQLVADVFPTNLQDKLMFTGHSAEIWLEPGKPATQGRIYREPKGEGAVGLVLGAGNVASIAPMDVLHKLFVEDEVCVLKMNPVNEHSGPHVETAFASLIADGFMAVVYGGVEVGKYLTTHECVETLHVTGSDRTYDAIVWGPDPEEAQRRKDADEPVNTRPFSAELGCVTPVLVVPGPWSDADLEFQAKSVAGMVTQNGSFNCNAAKVVVLARGWDKRESFLQHLRTALSESPPRKAYYPGAAQRYSSFVEKYPGAEVLGSGGEDIVPWTLIPDVQARSDEYALSTEAFCGVLAQVDLDCSTPGEFLRQATEFANESCWGTLSCMVLVHPKTCKAHAAELDRAIAELRYGGIAINCWAGLIYGLCVTTWGAFPGHTPKDIRSGMGVVHNTFLFDHPQKSVVRAPFRIQPPPVWFSDHKNLAQVGQKLVAMESEPGWGKLVGVALAAFKG
ncbi:MAG TPA: aldehyde dehydrogenase family protein [Myxococcota bacterium]|nr:aldehyde dehydrogenase family protein [Myxococcota bacterium]